MRVISTPAWANSYAATAASFTLCEPVRSEPGMTRILGADILSNAFGETSPPRKRKPTELVLAIHPDAGRRKVHPDPLRGLCGHAGQRFRDRGHHGIGKLHEGGAGRERGEGVADEPQ